MIKLIKSQLKLTNCFECWNVLIQNSSTVSLMRSFQPSTIITMLVIFLLISILTEVMSPTVVIWDFNRIYFNFRARQKQQEKISKTVMSFIIFVLAFAVSESTERKFSINLKIAWDERKKKICNNSRLSINPAEIIMKYLAGSFIFICVKSGGEGRGVKA